MREVNVFVAMAGDREVDRQFDRDKLPKTGGGGMWPGAKPPPPAVPVTVVRVTVCADACEAEEREGVCFLTWQHQGVRWRQRLYHALKLARFGVAGLTISSQTVCE